MTLNNVTKKMARLQLLIITILQSTSLLTNTSINDKNEQQNVTAIAVYDSSTTDEFDKASSSVPITTEINLIKELLVENASTIKVDLNEELKHDEPVIIESDDTTLFENENITTFTSEEGSNTTTTNINETESTPTSSTSPKPKIEFNSLKDIAYYLRSHKFNEYDRRYETQPNVAPRTYYMHFPKPPLRSLHWEVHRYCEPSFEECVNYLWKTIKTTGLKRVDDTSVVIQEQNWSSTNDSLQIDAVDSDCLKMAKIDDVLANPFAGPIERFQWRTTASYFMCWYTMKGQKELEYLNENCDNFAYCLDRVFGPNNKDFRADNTVAFSCALYSFCPDSCCTMKHLTNPEICYDSPENPCFENNPPGGRRCLLNRSENTDFRDIILNRWNVSCNCQEKGFKWNSLYGICVDVDECLEKTHNCDGKNQACVNLRGGYRCACKWGHEWNPVDQTCDLSKALSVVTLKKKGPRNDNQNVSYVRKFARIIYEGVVSRIFNGSTNGVNNLFDSKVLCCVNLLNSLVLIKL